MNDIVITRKRQLYGVSWPILLALFVFLIGDVVIEQVREASMPFHRLRWPSMPLHDLP